MPRIDPVKLLACIGLLLSPNGGIKSAAEVKRLASLMSKYSKKLVSKCIYIQILKSTDTELLESFMGSGGWALVINWLQDSYDSKNWPLVQELLELLLLCPVDVPRLQSNAAPKLVKGLSREAEHERVQILASKLVEQWLKIARSEIPIQNANVVNKDMILNAQSQIIVKTIDPLDVNNLDASIDVADELDSMDAMETFDVIDGNSDDIVAEYGENEALVFKITMKDGKQTLAKVNDASPKKASPKDTDLSKKTKSSENRSKDKDSKDRDKSKDRHKKASPSSSSSSSSTHKSSSKLSSTSSSSSKSNSGSSKSSSNSSSSSKPHKSSSSSSHKSSSTSSSTSRDKDKDKDKLKKSSSSISSSSSSKDKDRGREKEKERAKEASKAAQAEKDRDTLAKIQSQALPKVGKIPKKTNSDGGEKAEKTESEKTTDKTATLVSAKRKSISIEVRKDTENRPKTVKTYNSQFRSHGLGEEAPPPPSRKDLKKPMPVALSPSLPVTPSITPKRSLSPTNSREVEKKIKLATAATISATGDKPGAIKLIQAKPKPSVLIESDMFMDAMTAATAKKEVRKRKRAQSGKEGEENAKAETKSGQPSKDAKVAVMAPMRFYQDTLEDNDNKDDGSKDADGDDDDSREKKARTDNGDNDNAASADSPEEPAEQVKREPGQGCGPDGPPGVLTLHRRKGPKKTLRWRPAEQLEEVRFFELDETERINVTKTFVDAKQSERTSERESFLISRKIGSAEDVMVEQMPWQPLIEVDDVQDFEYGSSSKEKIVQADREKTCLKTIYFNRSMIPDSPLEPDVITFQHVDVPIIPLLDVTGNPDGVHDFSTMPWPEAKTELQPIGNFDDLALGNFSALNQFNNLNWQAQNTKMLSMRPQQQQQQQQLGFGPILSADGINLNAMNPMQAFNAAGMTPMLGQSFGPNNVGFMNNFNQNVPQMMANDGRNRGANWFTGNNNNSNQSNNNWKSGNNANNNQRQGWVQNRRICKQFQRGFCRHGDSCKFYHPANGPKF